MIHSIIINKTIRAQQTNDNGTYVVDLIKGDVVTISGNQVYMSRKLKMKPKDRIPGDFVRKDKDAYWQMVTIYDKHQDVAESIFQTIRSWNNDANYKIPE